MARKEQDARDFPIEQPDDVVLPSDGPIAETRRKAAKALHDVEAEDGVIQVSSADGYERKAELLRFYEEELDVMIMDSPDPNPEPFVFLAVNGRGAMPMGVPWCPRNEVITIKRKYVELLARAKPINVRTVDGVDRNGDKTKIVRRSAGVRYPFSVLRDPNPRGAAWLRDTMRQRA